MRLVWIKRWKKFLRGAICVEIKEFDTEYVLIRHSRRRRDIRRLPTRGFKALLTILKASTCNIDSTLLQTVCKEEGFIFPSTLKAINNGEGFIISYSRWPAPLQFTLIEWTLFVLGVKQGEFDEYIIEQ
jgi:hypothetical protein